MTAFLKIDRCRACERELPWEWCPPILVAGVALAGTGVWRSTLVDGCCAGCREAIEAKGRQEKARLTLRQRFIRLAGGIKPYRDYIFDRFEVTPGNRTAFDRAKAFDPRNDNLYLWGACGVGKTHLAVSILRRWFARGITIAMVTPFQLIRNLRMKTPEEEQQAIDGFVGTRILVIDDLGVGGDTTYARQVLQEILDGRDSNDRGGLIVTSLHPPAALARHLNDQALPSRLMGMCRIVEMTGPDRRPGRHGGRSNCDTGRDKAQQ